MHSQRKSPRKVKHVLKDGTFKTYEYPAFIRKQRYEQDSVASLIKAYQSSPEWLELSQITRAVRTIHIRTLEGLGKLQATDIRRRDLLQLRDAIGKARGNGAANQFLATCAAVFGWAEAREWIPTNPALRLPRLSSGHWRAWSPAEAALALATLPAPWNRLVWLGLYTGQRRADLVRMKWSDFDGETIRVIQQKTGTKLRIPVHPKFREQLSSWPRLGETIIAQKDGRPFAVTTVSATLPMMLERIGIRGLNVHGIRKLAAAMLAEAGCTVHEIASITGHKSLSMVQLYTTSSDQWKLAQTAIHKLDKVTNKRLN